MQGLADLLASALFRVNSILTGEFRLTSGTISHIYIDMRRAAGVPWTFRLVSSLLAAEVEGQARAGAVIAGVAIGGIPWASALSLLLGAPMAYVRSKKEYGTKRAVEGAEVKGRSVVVIDDVATTGSSLVSAVRALRAEAATVEEALVIVDREQGAAKALSEEGVRLRSLVTLRDLLDAAGRQGLIAPELKRTIERELWGG